jgi:hypothetical protein
MSDERASRPRERRYVVMPKETVQLYAESIGLSDLNDEVLTQLAEDVSYRLRDIIQVRLASSKLFLAKLCNLDNSFCWIEPQSYSFCDEIIILCLLSIV